MRWAAFALTAGRPLLPCWIRAVVQAYLWPQVAFMTHYSHSMMHGHDHTVAMHRHDTKSFTFTCTLAIANVLVLQRWCLRRWAAVASLLRGLFVSVHARVLPRCRFACSPFCSCACWVRAVLQCAGQCSYKWYRCGGGVLRCTPGVGWSSRMIRACSHEQEVRYEAGLAVPVLML